LIPETVYTVTVRAHDIVDGFGGQEVIVNLNIPSGVDFEVIRDVFPNEQKSSMGLTYIHPDGNRFAKGSIDLMKSVPFDIQLAGTPAWVVGAPQGDQDSIWLVALSDGQLQAFRIQGSAYTEIQLDFPNLFPGMPPAIATDPEGFKILNIGLKDLAPFSHPIKPSINSLIYINNNGNLIIESNGRDEKFKINVMKDGRILADGQGNYLVYSDPTNAYDHGVLGDAIEAASLTLLKKSESGMKIISISAPKGSVFEGIAPIWADLNNDGQREIIVTASNYENGAQIIIYSLDGEIIAQGPSIGSGYRWRHQLAVAPFGPNGEVEIVDVLTPHIGGIVEFFQIIENEMINVAKLSGYSSHRINSRNLDMAFAGDVDADGYVELLIPNQTHDSISALQRVDSGVQIDWTIPLNDKITTNFSTVTFSNNKFSVAVGLSSGILRVWLP
jgi:hypothetical protein